jgi:hypothetical protein
MGLVRKTFSVGTLGLVSFRSKKEKLRRAEGARNDAELALEEEHHAREHAEVRVAAAEKRVKHATAEAARTAHKLEKEKTKRRKRRAAVVSELVAGAEPIVRSGVEGARSAGSDAAKRGRKAGRGAAKHGRKAGRRARRAAARATVATKEAVAPRAEKVASRVSEKVGEVIDQL